MTETFGGGPGAPTGPRPTMPPATNVPDDVTGASAPQPPAPPAPQWQPPARRRNHRWWLLVGAGGLLVAAGSGGLSWGDGGLFTSSATQTQTYQAGSLDFTGGSSDIRVVGGAPGGTIEVTRHLRWGMGHGQPTPKEQVQGQTLAIDSRCGGGFMSMCSIDYELKVPDGAQVTIGVGSGDIDLSGVLGAIKGDTGSGDVTANGLSSTNTVLRSGSGDLDLSFTAPPSNVDLRTGSGDVSMWVPKGDNYAVDVMTGSGDKNITVDTSQSSGRSIHVQTGSGDVDLAYR